MGPIAVDTGVNTYKLEVAKAALGSLSGQSFQSDLREAASPVISLQDVLAKRDALKHFTISRESLARAA
jgi:hypothetical protein